VSYSILWVKFSPRGGVLNPKRATPLIKDSNDEIARVVRPRGKVISFGWNSNGMGEGRGFKKLKILLVYHGGAHNDTICVVEQKMKANSILEGLP
jgi:hypothetical protein